MRLLITGPTGHEDLIVHELSALGYDDVSVTKGGVYADLSLAAAYRVCLWLRTGSRVLAQVGEASADNADSLYSGTQTVDWAQHLSVHDRFAVDVQGTCGTLTDARFSALRIKDAIADQFRARGGARPDVDVDDPDVMVRARVHKGRVNFYVDLSGPPLHRRGYRTQAGPAPLRETAASAMLFRARWPSIAAQGRALLDPMCGAGTLLIEGAWMAMDVAPGLLRTRWGFDRWAAHDASAWSEALREARARATAGTAACACQFIGRDGDARVLFLAEENVRRAGLDGLVSLARADIAAVKAPDVGPEVSLPRGLVVVNPPYGERLGDTDSARATYSALGEALRSEFEGWHASVLAGDPGLGMRLGLRARRKNTLHNGPIKCDLLHLEITEAQIEAANTRRAAWHEVVDGTPVENRIKKNLKRLKPWLGKEGPDCFRVYDADIPEFNAAVDRYRDAVVVFEYEAPPEIARAKSAARLDAVVRAAGSVFSVAPDEVVVKRRRRQRGDAQYERMGEEGARMEVSEGDVRVWVNLRDYLDTGLFLDHRPIRRWFGAHARGKRFLNLFCYTGVATVHAAVGGARRTTSVDLSQRYLDWAADNLRLNRCFPATNELVRADVMAWVRSTAAERARWDLIFVDPPTFSNSKRMEETFEVQRDHAGLLREVGRLCAPGGQVVFSCNKRRFQLDSALDEHFDVEDVTEWSVPPDYSRQRPPHRCYRLRPR